MHLFSLQSSLRKWTASTDIYRLLWEEPRVHWHCKFIVVQDYELFTLVPPFCWESRCIVQLVDLLSPVCEQCSYFQLWILKEELDQSRSYELDFQEMTSDLYLQENLPKLSEIMRDNSSLLLGAAGIAFTTVSLLLICPPKSVTLMIKWLSFDKVKSIIFSSGSGEQTERRFY